MLVSRVVRGLRGFRCSLGLGGVSARPVLLRDSPLPQHINSDYNNPDTPFEWTPASQEKIKEILARYPPNYKQSAVIPLLWLAQKQNNNWIPLAAMDKIAKLVDVAPIRVYETCTFYTMFNREPVGKYHIQLCGTTPCMVRGAEGIMSAIEQELGITHGETTEDKLFTLTEVECLGACVNAPMIQINDEFFEDLTPESTKELLRNLKAGKPVKVGPQINRNFSEGPLGRTSLTSPPPPPTCRDLEAAKKAYEAKKAAAAEAAKAAAASAPPKK